MRQLCNLLTIFILVFMPACSAQNASSPPTAAIPVQSATPQATDGLPTPAATVTPSMTFTPSAAPVASATVTASPTLAASATPTAASPTALSATPTRTFTPSRTPAPSRTPTPGYVFPGPVAGSGLTLRAVISADGFRVFHSGGRIFLLNKNIRVVEIDLTTFKIGKTYNNVIPADIIFDSCVSEGTVWGLYRPVFGLQPSALRDGVYLRNHDLASSKILDMMAYFGMDPYAAGFFACSRESFWISNSVNGLIQRVESGGPGLDPILVPVASGPAPLRALHYYNDQLWASGSSLFVINKSSGTIHKTFPYTPDALAVDERHIWMAFYDDGILQGVNREDGEELAPISLGCKPNDLASNGKLLLVACDDFSAVAAFGISD